MTSGKMDSLNLLIILIIGFNLCAAREPSKIVGGQNSHPGEIPYIVSLTIAHTNKHECGGSLISSKHVLTAAHCFHNYNNPESWKKLVVITGATNHEKDGERHHILKVSVHPEFMTGAENRWRNDIAVVTVRKKIEFSSEHDENNVLTI